MPDFMGRLHARKSKPPKCVKGLRRLYLFTHFLFLKYERTAITVQITVATQVTAAITISHVIRKPPKKLISTWVD